MKKNKIILISNLLLLTGCNYITPVKVFHNPKNDNTKKINIDNIQGLYDTNLSYILPITGVNNFSIDFYYYYEGGPLLDNSNNLIGYQIEDINLYAGLTINNETTLLKNTINIERGFLFNRDTSNLLNYISNVNDTLSLSIEEDGAGSIYLYYEYSSNFNFTDTTPFTINFTLDFEDLMREYIDDFNPSDQLLSNKIIDYFEDNLNGVTQEIFFRCKNPFLVNMFGFLNADIYQNGYRNGFNAGVEYQSPLSFEEGRLAGIQEQLNNLDNPFIWLKMLGDNAQQLLNVRLAGPVTIGLLIAIPLIMLILRFVLGLFR